MSMINTVIIIDDEPLARINLRMLIEKYTDWKIILELDNGMDVEAYVNQLEPDLIFMDVRMPQRNGISAATGLLSVKDAPLIVFTSAFSDYALQAFELYALDYLLKPFSDDRFKQTLERLKKFSGSNDMSMKPADYPAKNFLKILIVRSVGLIQVVDLKDVIWFRGCGNYVEVILQNLDPNIFSRCHRSAIVRLSSIKEIRSQDDGQFTLMLKNGDTLKLSQSYKETILASIEK
jgi:DNA-binding LytR/AlgR family response regulator